jgi:hypothetical protein
MATTGMATRAWPQFVRGDTTPTIHTLARLMGITVLAGSSAAYSLAPARGIAVTGDAAATMDGAVTMDAAATTAGLATVVGSDIAAA